MLDEINLEILNILQQDARTSNADIARQVGLTPSATLERIRKLETNGYIQNYEARLDGDAMGLGLIAFIFVNVDEPIASWEAGHHFAEIPQVLEVHHITGEDCYLLKVRVKDTKALGLLLKERLGAIETVTSTRTVVALKTVKETFNLPLGEVSLE
ncbi:MAG: Lrp/AsnC family transcriptional regulator [Chloroflexi bacterium]|nr:Lrp/AsnC family transcriptional regulator [Chloroflexota bacterium]